MADALSALPDDRAGGLPLVLVGTRGLPSTPGIRWAPPRRWWAFTLTTDAVSICLSLLVGTGLSHAFSSPAHSYLIDLDDTLLYVPLYVLALAAYGLYQRNSRRLRSTSFLDIGPLMHALAAGALATLLLSAPASHWFGTHALGGLQVTLMTLPAVVLAPLGRAGLSIVARRLGSSESRVVIVGSGLVAESLARRLQRSPGTELLGFVDDEPFAPDRLPCRRLGNIADLPRVCAEVGADRVVIAFSKSSPPAVAETLRKLGPAIRISVVPRMFELLTWQSQVEEVAGLTLMDVAPPQLSVVSHALKRGLDILVSITLLLFLLPAVIVIAIAIKTTSKGPVLFRQDRTGRGGKVFQIFKFRTMENGADKIKGDLRRLNEVDGPLFKLREDPRVTRVGAFLRKTSLDEVPQLVNVLIGHMSLVGPRPFVPDESARIDGWAARRFDVRPGMTGLWQISGRNDLPFQELRQLDYAYVASWSLWWDLKILWSTPGSVLRRHGAY